MHFDFPGYIKTEDLRDELESLFVLLESELDEVANVQVSLQGVRGGKQYRLSDNGNSTSNMVFDRVPGPHGSWQRVARPRTMVEMAIEPRRRGLSSLIHSDSDEIPLRTVGSEKPAAGRTSSEKGDERGTPVWPPSDGKEDRPSQPPQSDGNGNQ